MAMAIPNSHHAHVLDLNISELHACWLLTCHSHTQLYLSLKE